MDDAMPIECPTWWRVYYNPSTLFMTISRQSPSYDMKESIFEWGAGSGRFVARVNGENHLVAVRKTLQLKQQFQMVKVMKS